MLSSIFVSRPRLAAVIAIVTTIAGLVSLLVIPIAQYPDIVPPQVSVTTTYPGASAAVVESTVAQPIESQVVGVDKAIYMKSVSGNDGSYTLLVSFELGTDPDINTVNVNNRVQVALSKLPEDVRKQGVTVKKKSSALLGVISLYSPKSTHDELFISNYATINLLDTIRATPGVGDASLFGAQDYSIRAWVRTDRLTGLDLTTGDIIKAIQSQNVQAAVGRIGARPISNDQQLQLSIQTKGRLSSVAEFEQIIIRTNPDGSVLRLGDVARLELGAANLDRSTRLNGGPAALMAIYQAPGANALTTLAAVKQGMAAAEKDFPDDLAWKVTYDPTTFVTDTMHEVQKTLVEAFILVVLVVYLFLGSFRATLIPTIAVPVSLIGAFVVLNAIGYSANTVSLLAVVLAIGIVVDDAIVVVEAVEAMMEAHPEMTPAEATIEAMKGITAPIIAITLVLLSVFVPVAFIPGISGELFRQFAVTVAVAMFLSAINALTLSPSLCALLLKPHHGPRRGPIGVVMRSIDRVRDGYGAVVARLVRISIIGVVAVAASMLGVYGLGKVTPTGFLPEEDQGAFFIVIQLPDGASVGRTTDVVQQVEERAEAGGVDRGLQLNHRPEFHRQLLAAERRLFDRLAQALRGEEGRIRGRAGDHRAARPEAAAGARRPGGADCAAADHRSGHWRRLQFRAAGFRRRQSARACTGTARLPGGCQPGPEAGTRVQYLLGDEPVGLPRHRSRQGAGTRRRHQQHIPGTAGDPRRLLRQRHESVRPDLAGPGAGRVRGSDVGGRHLPDQCAQREGRDDPVAQPGRGACRHWATGTDPVQ